jgi:tetratricopeptide (TPR) repeat protein
MLSSTENYNRGGLRMLRIKALISCLAGMVVLLTAGALAQSSPGLGFNSEDSAFQRGLIALKDGHFEIALTELTAAEREFPSDAHIRNFRGVTLARLGRNDEATREYREAVRLDPSMEDAYRNLGLLEWTERHLDSAIEDLRHALAIAPDDSFAHYYLGRVLLESKNYRNGLSELNRSSVSWPEDPEFLIQLAMAYNALGRREEEGRTLDRLLTVQLDSAQALAVVDLLLSVKSNDAATHLLQTLMQHQEGRHMSWARFDLARAYLMVQDYASAAIRSHEYIEASLRDLPSTDLAPAWSLLGIAEANLKNSDSAVSAFREATRLQPGNEEYCLNLTRELMDLTRYDEVIAAIQTGLGSNPKSYALHLRLGAAYLASGRYGDAENAFRQLVEANDPLPISYVGLAQVLLRTGRAQDAVTELIAAEHKLGARFLIEYFLGLALKRADRSSDAASAFAEAVQLNPSSAEAHRDLGSTLLSLGKVNEAISQLEASLHLAPNDVRTRRLLSRAYARSGDMNTAQQYSNAENEPPASVTDLQGDFIVPPWEYPPRDDPN